MKLTALGAIGHPEFDQLEATKHTMNTELDEFAATMTHGMKS